MIKSKTLILITIFFIIFNKSYSFATIADGIKEYLPPNQYFLEDPNWDILVVTVKKIDNENTTNKNPPKGRFEVDEVLRGHIKEATINLIWRPPDRPNDHKEWKDGDGTEPSEWYKRPFKDKYYSELLPAPKKGDKLIVFTLKKQRAPNIATEVVDVYSFTQENRQTVLDNMAPQDRSGVIQTSIFYFILLTPIICMAFLIITRTKSYSLNKQKKIRLLIIGFATIVFGLYAFYESGISVWTNIRVDLLLIYPALLLNAIIVFAAFIQLLKFIRKKN